MPTPRKTANAAADSTWVPQTVLDDAMAQWFARAGGTEPAIDPLMLLHAETRIVQKYGVNVERVDFFSPALRPCTGKTLEVRFDAAAADRGHLSKVVVRIGEGANATFVECLPRATAQDILDRNAVRQDARSYQQGLVARVQAAVEAGTEMMAGVAAAERQAALHRKRRVQGRPGQQHSGYAAPRPEVEQGVRDHQDQVLRRKARNRGMLGKNDPKKTRTGPRQAPASSPRPGSGEPSPNPWQDMAADSAPSTTSKAKRHSA